MCPLKLLQYLVLMTTLDHWALLHYFILFCPLTVRCWLSQRDMPLSNKVLRFLQPPPGQHHSYHPASQHLCSEADPTTTHNSPAAKSPQTSSSSSPFKHGAYSYWTLTFKSLLHQFLLFICQAWLYTQMIIRLPICVTLHTQFLLLLKWGVSNEKSVIDFMVYSSTVLASTFNCSSLPILPMSVLKYQIKVIGSTKTWYWNFHQLTS